MVAMFVQCQSSIHYICSCYYYLQYVENIGVPIVILGVLSVCAGVLSLRLPETKGQPTPETLEELRSRSAVEQSYHESRVIVS